MSAAILYLAIKVYTYSTKMVISMFIFEFEFSNIWEFENSFWGYYSFYM